jgi:hypothetical protein
MFAVTDVTDLRVLDFDIENRPLAYWYDEKTTAEVTAIAASWEGSDFVHVRVLTRDQASGPAMLRWFAAMYDAADMVTGHFIRGHDLPLLNGAMIEHGIRPLGAKLVSDTRTDLYRRKDLSASQEALAGMYGLPEPKHHMAQFEWREANRLTPEGIAATRERVTADVKQHKALRARLLDADQLKPPTIWHP